LPEGLAPAFGAGRTAMPVSTTHFGRFGRLFFMQKTNARSVKVDILAGIWSKDAPYKHPIPQYEKHQT
jgi:hypothetical protein